MFSRTLVTLALLSTTAMAGTIQNIRSSHFLTYSATMNEQISNAGDWYTWCWWGQSGRTCYFWSGDYLYDNGNAVVRNSNTGTPWTIVSLPSGYSQIKSTSGKCWDQDTSRGDQVYLNNCDNTDTNQWWDIADL